MHLNKYFFHLLLSALVTITVTACSSYPYPKYQVDPTPTTSYPFFKDTNITANIKSSFADDPILPASSIHVTTTGGVVKLTGTVQDPGQITRAEQLARQTPGVKLVESELKIIPPLR